MNKYLEKIAFARLSEASFKNLRDDEKAQLHQYITHDANKGKSSIVKSNMLGGGLAGGFIGAGAKKTGKAALIGAGLGAIAGIKLGERKAEKVRTTNVDRALNNANLASVLRQPINGN